QNWALATGQWGNYFKNSKTQQLKTQTPTTQNPTTQNSKMIYDVAIVGGGLAGLVSSIELARQGWTVVLIERKSYPFHRVCGEYISNEVRPYLQHLGLDLVQLGVKNITRFAFTSPSGRTLQTNLDLGGFGISRYVLDFELYQLAQQAGVQFLLNQNVEDVQFIPQNETGFFELATPDFSKITAKMVLGAYGKAAKIDKTLNRDFTRQKSPYVGVKYHIRTADFPTDLIALHNFEDGYCGISAIEADKYCLCYLTTRNNLRQHGNIAEMERAVLHQNPHLKRIFTQSEFLYERPEVINEFSFAPKTAVENHMLMIGDAAGLIAPLCGNGMAMAIHGGKIAAQLTHQFLKGHLSRVELEAQYSQAWRWQFGARLWVGRNVQRLFGRKWLSELALSFFKTAPPLLTFVMKQTHGKTLEEY
ncbi:MAG: NAD(P)/FAD-dependent oxidoreductase, partial [Runella slithyformis]